MTEAEELTNNIRKIVRSVITSQLALEYNEEIKHTPYYRHVFKRELNGALKVLRKAEKDHFDEFLDTLPDPDSIDYLFDQQFEMINQISKVPVPQFADVSKVIHAYLLNPKSIIGIANKVNKMHIIKK